MNLILRPLAFFCFISFPFQTVFAQAGDLDPNFGNNGTLVTDSHLGHDFLIQPDGKLVLGGFKYVIAPTNTDLLITRRYENGTVDPGFGINGTTSIDFSDLGAESSRYENFSDASLLTNGRIVVCGVKNSYFTGQSGTAIIAVLQPNGTVDPSFGNLGRRLFEFDSASVGYTGVEKFSNGDFLLWATLRLQDSALYTHLALIRFNSDGSLNTAFGMNGDGILLKKVGPVSPFMGQSPRTYLKVAPDDKIVMVGATSQFEYVTNRFNEDGSDDLTFGVAGQALTYVGLYAQVEELAIQPDNKIVIWGHSRFAGDPIFTIVRLNANGTNDNTWDDDGVLLQDVGDYDNEINAGALQSDGKVLAAGRRLFLDGTDQWVIARFNSDGTLDLDFGVDGLQGNDFDAGEEIPYGLGIAPDHSIYASGRLAVDGNLYWLMAKYLPGAYTAVHTPSSAANLKASVAPNLTSPGGNLLLQFDLPSLSKVSAQLIDSKGNMIQDFFAETPQIFGNQSRALRLRNDLPSGMYRLLLTTEHDRIALPVLLKR